MMHKAWSSIEEVPYYFSMSSINFEGHMGQKIIDLDPNWAFPHCNSSLNSLMAITWCTKLGSSIEEMPHCFSKSSVKFQWHTKQKKKSPILTRIWRFRTVTHRWLWNGGQSFRRGTLLFLAATKQLYEWYFPSVCHTFFTGYISPSLNHHEIFRSYYQWQK